MTTFADQAQYRPCIPLAPLRSLRSWARFACVIALSTAAAQTGCGQISPPAAAVVGPHPIPQRVLANRLSAVLTDLRDNREQLGPAQRRALKQQLLGELIRAEWVSQEAASHHVAVSDFAVAQAFANSTLNASHAYVKAMGPSGSRYNPARIQLLRQALVEHTTAEAVSDAAIRQHYSRHKRQYGVPERRDFGYVVTTTHAAAQRARDTVAGGADWGTVRRRFSIDTLPRQHRTGWVEMVKSEFPKPARRLAFRAPINQIRGPVKVGARWLVFAVQNITPPKLLPLHAAQNSIRNVLAGPSATLAARSLDGQLWRKFRHRTICSDGFNAAECRPR